MNQSYVQPIPLTDDATEWVDVNTIKLHTESEVRPAKNRQAGSQVAVLRYRFNPESGCYQYVQTGPLLGMDIFEGNISRFGRDWIIAARRAGREPGIAWLRLEDPLNEAGTFTIPEIPACTAVPLSVYHCPDGMTRLCSGDITVSPYQSSRDPIFLWDIDPDNGFRASNRHQIYSPREDGNPIPEDHGPLADMVKLLPHAGGNTQLLIHRVRTCAMAVKEADYPSRIRPLTGGDFTGTAIYGAWITYDEDYPGHWEFA